MSLPEIVDHDAWYAAGKEFLAREKELTRELDRLAADRRRLPMTRVEKDYRFSGPDGEVGLRDLFGDRRQLIVQHFMFDPDWDEGCSSCTAMADSTSSPGTLRQLAERDTAFAAVSRAPVDTLLAYREARGWSFPWYSSYGSDFNTDFHVSFDPDVAPADYNFRDATELEGSGDAWLLTYRGEQPGISWFLRDGEEVFRTYSTFGRGVDVMLPTYHLLDRSALGRQEAWEEPRGRAEVLFRSDAGVLSSAREAPGQGGHCH